MSSQTDLSDIFIWNAKVSNTYFSFGSAVKKTKVLLKLVLEIIQALVCKHKVRN